MAVSSPPRPPAQDDPEALIPEARDRQRRRRLLGLAAVASAVALGLGIYGAATGGGPLGTIRGSLGLGGTPKPCRSSQLTTQGVVGSGFLLTNTSRSACSLPLGIPRVAVFWHGQRLDVRQIHDSVAHISRMTDQLAAPVTHVLAPGKMAAISFYWRNWCGPPTFRPWIPYRMTFSFRYGKELVGSERLPFAPRQCTNSVAPSTIAVTPQRARPGSFRDPERSVLGGRDGRLPRPSGDRAAA
jgi:hypothetical protein